MKYCSILFFCLIAITALGQAPSLIIQPNIKLPKDSVEQQRLVQALSDFLAAAQAGSETNEWVYNAKKAEAFLLLDELKNVAKNGSKDTAFFFKPYLTNVVALTDSSYLIQVAYIGVHESKAFLRASFELVAYRAKQGFSFASPMAMHTLSWKTYTLGKHTFCYKEHLNKVKVKEMIQLANVFDKRLKATQKATLYYVANNLLEMQKLVGVLYKSDYNGRLEGVWSAATDSATVQLIGANQGSFESFDPHDLWHDRLSQVIARGKVYKPVDEGCAYLYGGSWGMSWSEVFAKFKREVVQDSTTDWTVIKENPLNFGSSQEKHLMADYVVNALIIEKLEREQGFDAVWQLLTCGKWEKGNAHYYKKIEQLTGISKANYNQWVWQLIRNKNVP